MADSKNKGKTTLDAFADDLDAMLTMDSPPAAQQVGSIDDDDAIDRLLMGDNFGQAEAENERDEFSDIDALIGDDLGRDRKVPTEFDEFGDDIDDMIANIHIQPKHQPEPVIDDLDEFGDDTDVAAKLVKDLDEAALPELSALESVGEIDEFADDFAEQIVPSRAQVDARQEDAESMKEIDEFPDIAPATENVADFLMADFDISSGEKPQKTVPPAAVADEFADDADVIPSAPTMVDNPEDIVEHAQALEESAAEDNEPPEPEPVAKPSSRERPQPVVDHSAELATLMSQITVLKKQQQVLKQELTEKSGREQLQSYLEEFDKLQTEQKKSKRAIDALADKKPIAAYVASGLAVFSLLAGLGLGFQGYIAKSQVGELVPIIAKLQEQGAVPAANDAAEKEMLRKQIDELTVASGVATAQIAELKKALQGDSGSTHAGVDFSKQLADLSSQNMQMGEAIENLQHKVNALEKLKTTAAVVTPKPEIKKPVVVEQNWAVNLIAFKQDWYANRKAEEFAAKGVPAKVVKSEAKGETWYRLFVDGFKSQYEAAGYAAKVKKTLNLDSVSVTRLKD